MNKSQRKSLLEYAKKRLEAFLSNPPDPKVLEAEVKSVVGEDLYTEMVAAYEESIKQYEKFKEAEFKATVLQEKIQSRLGVNDRARYNSTVKSKDELNRTLLMLNEAWANKNQRPYKLRQKLSNFYNDMERKLLMVELGGEDVDWVALIDAFEREVVEEFKGSGLPTAIVK